MASKKRQATEMSPFLREVKTAFKAGEACVIWFRPWLRLRFLLRPPIW